MGMSLVSLRPGRRWSGRSEDAGVELEGGVLCVNVSGCGECVYVCRVGLSFKVV